jgi:redox-sensing transcriptional repressor
MECNEVPDIVIRRLPRYIRSLTRLRASGATTVSSGELGEQVGITAAQVRRDLSYFGGFGKQGMGYDVDYLTQQLQRILNLTQHWKMVVVGVGKLGEAVARYGGFLPNGFDVVALFDLDPKKIGKKIDGMEVRPVSELKETVKRLGIRVAVITVPADHAQEVADALIDAGVRAILNYAPVWLKVPEEVWVRAQDPVVSLQSMTYYLACENEADQDETPAPPAEELPAKAY